MPKRLAITAVIISFFAIGVASAFGETVIMNLIDDKGIGKEIGSLDLSDVREGLQVKPQLFDLPPGDHGFHVHVNSDCRSSAGPNGQPTAGMAAGGHYDPANTGKHLGPHGEGHKGDMPVLIVDARGKAITPVTVPRLNLANVKGRSIIIHLGGDNFSDQPAPLGGGGARIACGVVK
jgi:Cu-Zn family superoxide dismutase